MLGTILHREDDYCVTVEAPVNGYRVIRIYHSKENEEREQLEDFVKEARSYEAP